MPHSYTFILFGAKPEGIWPNYSRLQALKI
jgi:hypothetical protein